MLNENGEIIDDNSELKEGNNAVETETEQTESRIRKIMRKNKPKTGGWNVAAETAGMTDEEKSEYFKRQINRVGSAF